MAVTWKRIAYEDDCILTLAAAWFFSGEGGGGGRGTSTVSNALSASKLTTSRYIGGTLFDGTADITVRTATSGFAVTGDLTATGNVTAYYSDERLKDMFGNIPDALNKVLSLNGFAYQPNKLAQSFGYKPVPEVGVSAQQVQKVLPEAVAPAPIDNKYMTVRYDRLIPLLIEAIKELSDKVDKLEARD